MPRAAFEASTLLGFNTRKVTTVAVVSGGDRMFVGTADGNLTAHDCRGDTPNALKAGSFECREVDSLRKGISSDKRPVLDLLAVEGWRALLGLLGGQLTAYDLYTYRPLVSVLSTRGASCFCVDEARRLVFVANKKRLQVLAWQAVSLAPKREFPLPETPRTMALVPGGLDVSGGSSGPKLVLSLRKEYSVMDATTGALTPALLLSDRDQLDAVTSSGTSGVPGLGGGSLSHGVILPVPASSARGARVLLSSGSRGLLVDLVGRGHEERLTWSAPPLSVCLSTAFFVAALSRQVEVHDLASLAPLQTFDLSGATCMVTCPVGGGWGDLTYVTTATSVNLLKLIPIEFQVETLAEAGSYEDALSLCAMCKDMSVLGSVNVSSIHERYAYDLFSWGDYEGAVGQFLVAETPVEHVLSLFPSLAPPEFVPPGGGLEENNSSGGTRRGSGPGAPVDAPKQLTGVSRSRAASAVMRFLEKHRRAAIAAAEWEEAEGEGQGDDVDRDRAKAAQAPGGGGRGGPGDGKAADTLVLLDTMLVSSYMQCSPPRHSALVELLSGPNRCSLEACAPLLAASGSSFVEALLCLYRWRGMHEDALALATEERCVASSAHSSSGSGGGGGGWTAPQFRRWLAAYLRELRLSPQAAHRALVLRSARSLLEADPALGLSVFLDQHRQGLSHGLLVQRRVGALPGARREGKPAVGRAEGKLAPHDVVSFLKTVTPSEPGREKAEAAAAAAADGGEPGAIPLTSGRALAVGYLQGLIDTAGSMDGSGGGGSGREGEVTSALHDELAYLLMEGLLVEQGAAADRGQSSRIMPSSSSSKENSGQEEGLAGAYRQRLQLFLQTSEKYNPARLLSVIPSHFLEEHALLLSRLGRHEEVLHIYVRQLKNRAMAEAYCARIWERCDSAAKARGAAKPADAVPSPDEEVYLCLLRVYLNKAKDVESSAKSGATATGSSWTAPDAPRGGAAGDSSAEIGGLDEAVSLLDRHFARVDPVVVMSLLPPDVPVKALLPFLGSALRHAEARRRNSQVMHQLCRADYVNVKFELIQLQGQVSRVPELSLASFPQLGTLLRTCPPVDLTDPTADYGVSCIKHVFESFVVLQFDVANRLRDQRLHNVLVKVECSDPDLYSIKTERHLPALPSHGSGSCYTVLARSPSTAGLGRGGMGGIGGSPSVMFMCELRFTSVRTGQGMGLAEAGYDVGGGFMEEYLLEDLELAPADLGE